MHLFLILIFNNSTTKVMPYEAVEVPQHLIEELRTRFLAESSTNHDLYYEEDVNDIRTKDWAVRRYLQSRKCDVDEALKMMINAMKWRKTIGINKLNENSFPREYYQIGGVFTYGKDLNGAQMIILRVKVNKKISEWTELLKKYIVFLFEKEDHRYAAHENNGVTIVFDCNGAGITNVDIDLLSFIVSVMRDYYPRLLSSVLINELPWVLQYVFKLVQTWLPKEQQKLLHLISKNELHNFVATEELPDFMGGTNELSYRSVPKNAPTAQEIADKIGLKKKDVDKLLNHLEILLFILISILVDILIFLVII
jgi:hypothetical protein